MCTEWEIVICVNEILKRNTEKEKKVWGKCAQISGIVIGS